jgi:dolichol kinase
MAVSAPDGWPLPEGLLGWLVGRHMSTAELYEDRDLTLQLHGLLSDIDPTRWRDDMARSLRVKLEEVARRMSNRQRLEPLREALVSEVPQLPTGEQQPLKARWLAFKQRMQPAYARVAEALRAEAVHVPSLRPTNHARSLMHLASGLGALLIIELAPWHWLLVALALGGALFAWTAELSRRRSPAVNDKMMKLFGPVAHAHETRRVNSATWYATALLLLSLTNSTIACAVAVIVLAVGDPMAGYVGRRYGRVKLLHGRSLEGTLAFIVTGTAAAWVVLRVCHAATLTPGASLLVALGAAVAGGVAELISLRVDDNFSIPVSAAAGAGLVLMLM